MRCVFCQIKNCNQCKASPFYRLPLDDEPFSELNIRDIAPQIKRELTAELSISGVQQKYSLYFDETSAKLMIRNKNGQFILKPELQDFVLDYQSFSVENEHISMQLIARMGIDTALSCIIPLGGHDLGYVTKRFDYIDENNKYQMEDFAQVLGIPTEDKYDPSIEEMGQAINLKVPAAKIIKDQLFKRVVANFILCNADAHVKNYSLISYEPGRLHLSPVYDVMNVNVHIPNSNESGLQLTEDNKDKIGLTKEAFEDLAASLGISEKRTSIIFSELIQAMDSFEVLLFNELPGLDNDIRNLYIDLVNERIQRLSA